MEITAGRITLEMLLYVLPEPVHAGVSSAEIWAVHRNWSVHVVCDDFGPPLAQMAAKIAPMRQASGSELAILLSTPEYERRQSPCRIPTVRIRLPRSAGVVPGLFLAHHRLQIGEWIIGRFPDILLCILSGDNGGSILIGFGIF